MDHMAFLFTIRVQNELFSLPFDSFGKGRDAYFKVGESKRGIDYSLESRKTRDHFVSGCGETLLGMRILAA